MDRNDHGTTIDRSRSSSSNSNQSKGSGPPAECCGHPPIRTQGVWRKWHRKRHYKLCGMNCGCCRANNDEDWNRGGCEICVRNWYANHPSYQQEPDSISEDAAEEATPDSEEVAIRASLPQPVPAYLASATGQQQSEDPDCEMRFEAQRPDEANRTRRKTKAPTESKDMQLSPYQQFCTTSKSPDFSGEDLLAQAKRRWGCHTSTDESVVMTCRTGPDKDQFKDHEHVKGWQEWQVRPPFTPFGPLSPRRLKQQEDNSNSSDEERLQTMDYAYHGPDEEEPTTAQASTQGAGRNTGSRKRVRTPDAATGNKLHTHTDNDHSSDSRGYEKQQQQTQSPANTGGPNRKTTQVTKDRDGEPKQHLCFNTPSRDPFLTTYCTNGTNTK